MFHDKVVRNIIKYEDLLLTTSEMFVKLLSDMDHLMSLFHYEKYDEENPK